MNQSSTGQRGLAGNGRGWGCFFLGLLLLFSATADAGEPGTGGVTRSFDVVVPAEEGEARDGVKTYESRTYEMVIPDRKDSGGKSSIPAAPVTEKARVQNSGGGREGSPRLPVAVAANSGMATSPAGASPRKYDAPEWTYSIGTWIGTGQTDFNHTSGYYLHGDPTSELFYRDLRGYSGEFLGKVNWRRWFARGLAGYGGGFGELIDDDFVSAAGAAFYATSQSGEHRYSRTLSDVNMVDMLYAQFDVGGHFYRSPRLKLGAYMGFHYWAEQYNAEGVTQLECTSALLCDPPGTSGFAGQSTITNSLRWHGMRIGLTSTLQVLNGLELNLDGGFLPLAFVDNEDTHHLRVDLAQNPSVQDSGLGLGYTLEGTVHYRFHPRLSVKVGYRYWHMQVNDGTATFYLPGGFAGDTPLNKLETYRHGGLLGVDYLF